jgi:hypothetical protein
MCWALVLAAGRLDRDRSESTFGLLSSERAAKSLLVPRNILFISFCSSL